MDSHPGYLIIDTETNTLPDYARPADADGQPRLAALALIKTDPNLNNECGWRFLIQPDGWAMAADATAVNGLTDARLAAEGVPVRDALDLYAACLDSARPVIAFNSRFDLKIMRGELRLAGMADRFEATLGWCAMRAANPIVKARGKTGRRKFPSLVEACAFFDIHHRGPHKVEHDAQACLEVTRALIKHGAVVDPTVHYAKDHAAIEAAR